MVGVGDKRSTIDLSLDSSSDSDESAPAPTSKRSKSFWKDALSRIEPENSSNVSNQVKSETEEKDKQAVAAKDQEDQESDEDFVQVNPATSSWNLAGTLPAVKSLEQASSVDRNSSNKSVTSGESGVELSQLNAEQRRAVSLALSGRSFFFTGSAGTGKSTTLRCLIRELEQSGRKVAVTASTGAAAILIDGTTLHSWAGVGLAGGDVDVLESLLVNDEKRKNALKRWKETEVLIVDEVSMIDPKLLSKFETLARRLRKSELAFGGIQLILCGDFGQLPPVTKGKVDENGRFPFQCVAWKKCIKDTVLLRQVHRQKDTDLIEMLNNIRVGKLTEKVKATLASLEQTDLTNNQGIEPTKLFARNVNVDEINAKKLAELKGAKVTMNAIDSGDPFYLDKLKRFCKLPEKLELKVGAQVILLKNLDISGGLVNGSRGVVLDLGSGSLKPEDYDEEGEDDSRKEKKDDGILVQFANRGNIRRIQTDKVEWKQDGKVVATRVQYPLRLAWAMTIHKSQGMTCDLLEVDLRGCFEVGQAYTALSRASSLSTLRVLGFSPKCVLTSPKVVEFHNNLVRAQET